MPDNLKTLFTTIQNKIKALINKTRIPSLLSFIISKDGKINPTVEEALKEAPPADQNWIRLGLDKKVFKKADGSGGIPVWLILALPIVMIVVKIGSGALQFFIEILSQGAMLIPFALVVYFIIKSFKK